LSSVGSALVLTSAAPTLSGLTTVSRPGRRRMVSGARTVMLAAGVALPLLGCVDHAPHISHQAGHSGHTRPDVSPARPHLDPFDQQPDQTRRSVPNRPVTKQTSVAGT
jgi:hypothetical protein